MTSSKKKIKIFIFSSVHRWNDTRILYKQATSLVKKYDVELHASAMFKHKKINGIDVFGLPQWYKVSERKKTREELWSRVKQSDADIFHFHDPELLWMGIKIRILLKKEVIYDIHEDYEKAILSKNWIPKYFRYLLSKLFYYFEQISVMVIKNIISTTNPISNKFKSLSLNKTIIFNFPLMENKYIADIQQND
ncbi:MAG: hypothetical protein ISS11_08295 [Candidatus Marinimicrobia bacterium]|nr:hypothetical protein [Candidatus Neomarinimicrobiota bacterium]